MTKEKEYCEWINEDSFEFEGMYETSCGEAKYFSNGNIENNNYKFCPFCGKEIKEYKNEN